MTRSEPVVLKIDGREHVVPPHTTVYPNIIGLATHEDYWGKDSLSWKPTRWIKWEGAEEDLEAETAWEPVKGSFIAWSDGARVVSIVLFSQSALKKMGLEANISP